MEIVGIVNDDAGLVVRSRSRSRGRACATIWAPDFDATVLMNYAEGADPDATRESVDAFLEERFPDTESRDQAQIKEDQESQLESARRRSSTSCLACR